MTTTLPPRVVRDCGNFFVRDDYFVGSCMYLAERLRDYYNLNPKSKILDVGCGCGRLLIGLIETGFPYAKYVGVDLRADCIAWLKEHYTAPKHGFIRIDAHSERYNPAGAIPVDDAFKFPLPDAHFDIIHLWAVWPHMYLSEIAAQLKEFARMLTPNGLVFGTGHFENDVPDEQTSPPHYPPRYGPTKKDGKMHRQRISYPAIQRVVKESGLEIVNSLHHNEWNYQSSLMLAKAKAKPEVVDDQLDRPGAQ